MLQKFLFLLTILVPLYYGADVSRNLKSELHEMQLNNSQTVMAALEMMPKECTKNGKTYKEGEDFSVNHLRYKCQKYGVYTIEGCLTKDDKPLNIGESVVIDNIKYQCLSHGSSIFFRETTCGIMGQPDCDKIDLPKSLQEAQKKHPAEESGKTNVNGVELPKGWSLVDGGSKKINGTNASVVTQILMFKPINSRRKRQAKGVGSVVGVEDMSGGDSGRPMMPMSMLMGANKKQPSSVSSSSSGGKVLKTGDKNDQDLMDLKTQSKVKVPENLKPGSTSGHQSITDWKGKTIQVNGKSIAAGPGTFTFGNHPSQGGIFLRKDD